MARDRSPASSKARTASASGTTSVSSGATSMAPVPMKPTAHSNSRSNRKVPRSYSSLATRTLMGSGVSTPMPTCTTTAPGRAAWMAPVRACPLPEASNTTSK